MKTNFFMSICWLVALAGFAACSDWSTPPVDYTDNMKVYLVPARAAAPKEVVLFGVNDTTITVTGVRYGGTQTPVGEITATLTLWDGHPSFVDKYNEAHGTEYSVLPKGVATLLDQTVTIPAGRFASPSFSLRIIDDNDLLQEGSYLLPIQVIQAIGLPVSEEHNTGYVVIKYMKEKLDVWEHGTYEMLYTHTEGQGIPIVIVGDGFDYKDNEKGGKYETVCRGLADKFLANPIIRDFREWFDIFMVVAHSENSPVTVEVDNTFFSSGVNPNFGWANEFTAGVAVGEPYAIAGRLDRCFIFVGNGMIGGYAQFGIPNGNLGWGIYSTDEPLSGYWMAHEFVGHGFASLGDEYTGSFSYGGVDGLNTHHDSYNICWNLSTTNDTSLAPWAQFIGREGYDEVGVYEGGFGEDEGIWRPEEWSIMVDNRNGSEGDEALYYNAQSRWIIYETIHKRADMSYSFETFLEYDEQYNVK